MERILEVEHNRPVKGILKENFRGVLFIHFWDICQEKKKRCKSAAFTSFIPVQFSLNLSVVHHVHALLKIKMPGPSQVLSVPALTSYGRPEELRTQVAMLARLCLR